MGSPANTSLARAIFVCALGYFIDVLDIQLFPVLRVSSLTELGVPTDRLAAIGGYILNAQMFGMIVGAFLWGWLGDRFGRIKALYGSILVYSVGTLACSLVHDTFTYSVLRFFTGFGLAGETGAAVTLVAELMPAQRRMWGIMLIAGFGFMGPAVAVIVSWFAEWRMTYVVAGVVGLILLVLRMKLVEPSLFEKVRAPQNRSGSLLLLAQPRQAWIFSLCLMIGCACVYSWNLLNFFSAEIGRAVLGDDVAFNQKICLLLFYIGTSLGDFASAAVSQVIKSRRKALVLFFCFSALVSQSYLFVGPHMGLSALHLYIIYLLLGFGSGSWILMCTIAAEQFGTNIRATTAILISNLTRGFTIPLVFAFQGLREVLPIASAAGVIGLTLYVVAFLAIMRLRETHGLDLDYVETIEKAKARS